MANVTIAVNTSNSDVEYDGSGSTWDIIVPASDYLVFSAGSDTVVDGAIIPTQSQLIQAGIVLTGVETIVDKYFLANVGENLLKQIHLMGNQDTQYVMAFDFDDTTATEPVLELWDDANLNTILGTTLGAGVAANSWWKAICTTRRRAGTDWSGTTMAGSADGRFLYLNDGGGALALATTLYCNLKIVVPATATVGTNATPKLVVKYTSN